MKKLPKLLTAGIKLLFGIAIVGIIAVLLIDYLGIYETVKPYVVMSGSMEPAIKLGSVAVVKKQNSYYSNDVITFIKGGNKENPITHRIIFARQNYFSNENPTFITAGDANEEFDIGEVKHEEVIGKVILTVPYLGYAVDFVKKPYGFILLVIVPATIVVYEELKTLFRELRRFLGFIKAKIIKKKPKNYSLKQNTKTEAQLPKSAAFVPIIGASLVFASLTGSYFLDMESSSGNIFQAADDFGGTTPSPTPTPIHGGIVINEVYYRISQEHRMGSEAESEWAELYNSSDSEISLENWSIEDNTHCDNLGSSQSIPSGGFAIVSTKTEEEFRSVWSSIPEGVIFITSPSAIGNGLANNDELILRSGLCPDGSITDHISWGSNTNGLDPSIPSVGSAGISLERNPDGIDTNTNTDFTESEPPTPGS